MPYKDPADWKAWRLRNHERQIAKERVYQAAYREANREKERAKYKRYYDKHRERVLARKREWKASEAGKAWFEGYRETHTKNVHRYRAKPDAQVKSRLREAKRRARKASAGGTTSYDQLMARIAYYGEKCYLCGAPWEQIDHVIPIAKGGSHWPSNLRPICALCNYRKSARSLEEVSRDDRRLAVVQSA